VRSRNPQRSRPRKRQLELINSIGPFDERQVLPFEVWCRLNDISPRTGRRILASGNGPRITQLSANRIGITYADNRAWQESRARGGLRNRKPAQSAGATAAT
jgi:hypothetical protein